jgi:DNA polymerase-3 subunit delta'
VTEPTPLFTKIKGQPRAAKLLCAMLSSARVPSAMVFTGMEGVGKTLMAVELSKILLCGNRKGASAPCGHCSDCVSVDKGNHPDLALVNSRYQAQLLDADPAKQKSLRVDTIRHLRKDMEMRSLRGGWKIAVLEDAHTLEIEAANALLKNLEEPHPGSLWILLTAQRERLPKTVLSRCFTVPFAPLSPAAVAAILEGAGVAGPRAPRAAALCEGSASRALELTQGEYPECLAGGPTAIFDAVDALPREGYLARTQVENALFALAQDLRLRHARAEVPFDRAERALREIMGLRQALRANADAKLVLTLAGLAAEEASQPINP